ncbi:MAG: CBS domain-containing protein [Desulfovibrionaceae bacterium]
MFVGLKMLKDFGEVTPDTLVRDADKIMEDSRRWMLLVMDGGGLVGYVRKEDIRAALPLMEPSLATQESESLLSQLTVDKILRKDIQEVSPETEIEAAADLMSEMNLGALAVSGGGQVVGYINRSVMLEVLVEEMGHRQGGSRITFEAEERPGVIYEVTGVISNMGYNIISLGAFYHKERRLVVIRVQTEDVSPIVAALQEHGYKTLGPEDFMEEWR